ncbi:unnamed protein product [Sympodiomycopsis kandeliae]
MTGDQSRGSISIAELVERTDSSTKRAVPRSSKRTLLPAAELDQNSSSIAKGVEAPSKAVISPNKKADDGEDHEDGHEAGDTESAAPPKRKSRVLRRKTDHSVIERRRREKINERLIRLQEMIPACREEALEHLERKPPKGARGAKVDAEVRKQEIARSLSETMVLEKLCIISHTVDYVTELLDQVAAYKRLCQCDPPLSPVAPRDPTQHVRFAHELGNHPATANDRSMDSSSNSSLSPSYSPVREVELLSVPPGAPTAAAGAPKRKRHWGSNRPVKAVTQVPVATSASSATTQTARSKARRNTLSQASAHQNINALRSADGPPRATTQVAHPSSNAVEYDCEGSEDAGMSDDDDDDDDPVEGGPAPANVEILGSMPDAYSRKRRASDSQSVSVCASFGHFDPAEQPQQHHYQHQRTAPLHLPIIASNWTSAPRLPFGVGTQSCFPGRTGFYDRSRHLHKISSILSLDHEARGRMPGAPCDQTIEEDSRGVSSCPSSPHMGDDRLTLLAKVSAGSVSGGHTAVV